MLDDLLVVLVLKIHLKLLKIIVTNQLMNPHFTGTIDLESAAAGSIFLNVNHTQLQAVAASGNRNWGQNFAKFLRNIKFH